MDKQPKRFILLFLTTFLLLIGAAAPAFAQEAEARKFDEYGKIAAGDEKARLDNFVVEMQNDAAAKGYIISYGGRRSAAKDAPATANRAKAYVLKRGKLDASRIVTINGGYKEEPTTELWIAPLGAAAPFASPTVDPSEVVPPKAAGKSKPAKPKKKRTAKRKA